MNVRILRPEHTLIISSGTFHPHVGYCYYDLIGLHVRRHKDILCGQIFLQCTSGHGTDPVAENILKRLVKYSIRKQARRGKLTCSTWSGNSKRVRKVSCSFIFKPKNRWYTSMSHRYFVEQLKTRLYKRICNYN
jgi:hypothetical protein